MLKRNIMILGLSMLLSAAPAVAFAEEIIDSSGNDTQLSEQTTEADKSDEVVKSNKIKKVENEDDDLDRYNVGWIQNADGTYSLYDGLGNMVRSSWCKVGGKWYYLKDDGIMATNWVKVEGSYYYVGQWGNMHTGWIEDGGLWYYLNEDGIMQKGWIKYNGSWYYLNQYGAMVTNGVIDGYTLGWDGKCQ